MSVITIISDDISPRLRYVCNLIFVDYLGISYTTSSTAEENGTCNIYYGQKALKSGVQIPCLGLLEEKEVNFHDPTVHWRDGLPFIYGDFEEDDYLLPFDLFSMCFYFLSRYEEYYDNPRDAYNRYQSKYSLAVIHGFIGLPIIDLWIQRFAIKLNSHFGSSFRLSGSYNSEVTIDIDLPYAFKGKGVKAVLGIARDIIKLDMDTAYNRIKYWSTGIDPFDSYFWIESFCKKYKITPKIFFLNKYQKPDDENHLANSEALRQIIKDLDSFAQIGIHPSLSAENQRELISQEKGFLEKSVGYRVTNSRQHFLQLEMKKTYNALIACGIRDDYSMGYPEIMGFRASTARPFRFYNLLHEIETNLTIHPCVTMDVTMQKYLQLSPAQSIESCIAMAQIIKDVKGTFSFIWHNSSLSAAYGWRGWKEVFVRLAQL